MWQPPDKFKLPIFSSLLKIRNIECHSFYCNPSTYLQSSTPEFLQAPLRLLMWQPPDYFSLRAFSPRLKNIEYHILYTRLQPSIFYPRSYLQTSTFHPRILLSSYISVAKFSPRLKRIWSAIASSVSLIPVSNLSHSIPDFHKYPRFLQQPPDKFHLGHSLLG